MASGAPPRRGPTLTPSGVSTINENEIPMLRFDESKPAESAPTETIGMRRRETGLFERARRHLPHDDIDENDFAQVCTSNSRIC